MGPMEQDRSRRGQCHQPLVSRGHATGSLLVDPDGDRDVAEIKNSSIQLPHVQYGDRDTAQGEQKPDDRQCDGCKGDPRVETWEGMVALHWPSCPGGRVHAHALACAVHRLQIRGHSKSS